MTTLLQIAAAVCFFGAFGFGLAALFARDEAVGWRRVLSALDGPGVVRVEARTVAEGAVRAPASGAAAVWYAAWATEHVRDDFQRQDADTHVAVFERSTQPVWVEDAGGARLALDPTSLWVEREDDDEDGLPFGAAPGHRAWSFMPRRSSWEEWEANRDRDRPVGITEILLAPDTPVEVYGRPARTPEGHDTLQPAARGEGVIVLRVGGGVAARAAERAAVGGARRRQRWRVAGAFGAAFVVCVAIAAATA